MSITNIDFRKKILILSPHQDDEILGLGILLQRFSVDRHIIFMTDGAPSSGYPMRKKMMSALINNRVDYAKIRKEECYAAAKIMSLKDSDIDFIDATDSELSFELDFVYTKCRDIIIKFEPQYIFFPAYEGGHPDHDATALIAKRLSFDEKLINIKFFEYPLYNYSGDKKNFNTFIPISSDDILISATQVEKCVKEKAINCYKSQLGGLLNNFSRIQEMIRPAMFDNIDGNIPNGKTYVEIFYAVDSIFVRESYDKMRAFLDKNLPRPV